jgi:hypothetical protein
MLDAADLSAVLQMVPPLLVAAETRWATQARYPGASRPPRQRSQPGSAQQNALPPAAPNLIVAATSAPSAAQGQLDLFA